MHVNACIIDNCNRALFLNILNGISGVIDRSGGQVKSLSFSDGKVYVTVSARSTSSVVRALLRLGCFSSVKVISTSKGRKGENSRIELALKGAEGER